MISRLLKIRGFLSYGEPAEIDFSAIRVACISGENGSGKSSLLDAMTWALFGKARSSDYSLINTSSGNNSAEVVFEFEYESSVYRIVRMLERGKTGRVDFLVWSDETEQWRILTENTLTGTNKQIVSTLHLDYDTFINVSFFLQGKADLFTNQPPTNRKKILSNILELEVWDRYKAIAAERLKQELIVHRAAELRVEEIDRELEYELPRRLAMEQTKHELDAVEKDFQTKNKNFTEFKILEERLSGQRSHLEFLQSSLSKRQIDLNNDRASRQKSVSRAEEIRQLLVKEPEVMERYQAYLDVKKVNEDLAQRAMQFNKLDREKTSCWGELQAMTSRLESTVESLQREIREIKDISSRYEERSHDLAVITEKQQVLEKNIAQKDVLNDRITISHATVVRLSGERSAFKTRLDDIQHKIEDLSAAGVGSPCPFCGRELDAPHSEQYLAQLEEEKKKLTLELQQVASSLSAEQKAQLDFQKQLDAIRADEKIYQQTIRQAEQLRSYIEQVEAKKVRETEIDAQLQEIQSVLESQSYGAEVRDRIAALEDTLVALDYNLNAHEESNRREKALSDAAEQRNAIVQAKATLEQLDLSIASLDSKISACEKEVTDLEENVRTAKESYEVDSQGLPDLGQLQAELNQIARQLDKARGEYTSALQLFEVLDALRSDKKVLLGKINASKQLIGQWKTLEQAFSKNGIPALLIEAALPEIEEYTNLMLGRLTDGRMSVTIRTQTELKTRDDLKETLEIFINDENGTRPYEMFSGGEMFRVNFAIRLALANMLAKRSGSRMQLLVIDEGFGSQDAEGRQRLIEAITEVQDDYATILVITHLEELKDAFPQRIEVEKGENGSTVSVYA